MAAVFGLPALVGFLGPTACGAPPSESAAPTLTVFAAASLVDVLPQVAAAWRVSGGGDVRFSWGSTSKIAAQLVAGAPADIVVCADAEWLGFLEAKGATLVASRVVLARNALVAVVPTDDAEGPYVEENIARTFSGSVALAGPMVPAGRYAEAALESMGLWDAVAPRIVRAEDVRGVLRWVALGEMDVGIVYATDALAESRVRRAHVFPASSHPPIVYAAALVRDGPAPTRAREFLAFCRGSRGQTLFRAAGFGVDEP